MALFTLCPLVGASWGWADCDRLTYCMQTAAS